MKNTAYWLTRNRHTVLAVEKNQNGIRRSILKRVRLTLLPHSSNQMLWHLWHHGCPLQNCRYPRKCCHNIHCYEDPLAYWLPSYQLSAGMNRIVNRYLQFGGISLKSFSEMAMTNWLQYLVYFHYIFWIFLFLNLSAISTVIPIFPHTLFPVDLWQCTLHAFKYHR